MNLEWKFAFKQAGKSLLHKGALAILFFCKYFF
jgi:hypothetical protein